MTLAGEPEAGRGKIDDPGENLQGGNRQGFFVRNLVDEKSDERISFWVGLVPG
jgi:hypothetical protein